MVRITVVSILAFAAAALAVGDPAGAKNVGNGKGAQFITGECISNADCASACCATLASGEGGVCSAESAQNDAGKAGCGFVGKAAGGAGAAKGKGKGKGASAAAAAQDQEQGQKQQLKKLPNVN